MLVGITLPGTTIIYLPDAVGYWDEYPIQMSASNFTTQESNWNTTKEILQKCIDEKGIEWYELEIKEQQQCTQGYVKSKEIGHHVPEEFIQFDGVDSAIIKTSNI